MRFVAATLLAVLLFNIASPLPASAMSTAAEISKGADISRQIDRQSLLVDDPFLTGWVNHIGNNLAQYRAREDITYTFPIINSNEINAFALPGGFVHVDMGLLNTVSSDDELASVMAHEMGHVERRHVVTLEQKSNILGILIGILSILSPITSILGGYGGDLAMNKFSRQDELQADQYGLLLMTRAGYDPQSMVDFMDDLRTMSEQPESKADKAFADHPVPSDRIAHLEGYPQLDNPSAAQLTADAIHDEGEGRYSYAQERFQQALRVQPGAPLATQHLAAVDVALRGPGANASPGAHMQFAFELDPAGRVATAALIQQALNITHDDALAAQEQEKWGRRDAESLYTQLQSLSGGVPNLGHPKTPNNNLATAIAALDRMVVDVNGALDLSSDVMSATPQLMAENRALLHDMGQQLTSQAPAIQPVLPYYPSIAAQLTDASDELTRAIDHARGSITAASDSVHLLKDYFLVLDSLDTTSGDIKEADMPRVLAALDKAQSGWDQVKALAMQADDEVYAAQSRWLSAHITMLDLVSTQQRYAAFRGALAYRFPGVATPDYSGAVSSGLPPGEISCAAWLSLETKQTVDQIIAQAQATGETCEDMALARGLLTESMEIAQGLVYQDYVDKPHKLK